MGGEVYLSPMGGREKKASLPSKAQKNSQGWMKENGGVAVGHRCTNSGGKKTTCRIFLQALDNMRKRCATSREAC